MILWPSLGRAITQGMSPLKNLIEVPEMRSEADPSDQVGNENSSQPSLVGPFARPSGHASSDSSPFAPSRHAWYRSLRALRLSLPVLGADKRATIAPTAIPRIRTAVRRINLLLQSMDGS